MLSFYCLCFDWFLSIEYSSLDNYMTESFKFPPRPIVIFSMRFALIILFKVIYTPKSSLSITVNLFVFHLFLNHNIDLFPIDYIIYVLYILIPSISFATS